MLSIAVSFALLFVSSTLAQFAIPEPEVIFYEPRGFRVSIPADPDIRLFGFHGARNRVVEGTAAGAWNSDVTRATDGKFIYEDSETKFQNGDFLSYWVNVILHNGQSANLLDLRKTADGKTCFPSLSACRACFF